MAFPAVQSRATSTSTTDATSHTVSYPASIQANDLLILIAVFDGDPGSITLAGWTEFTSQSTDPTCHVYWKNAAGTESGTFSLTSANGEKAGFIAYRISGAADPSLTPPVATGSGSWVSGSSTSPDPPSLTPTGGAKDYLWLAIGGEAGDKTVSSGPTNYSNLQSADAVGASASNAVAFAAERQLNAASENPGAFTLSGSGSWIAATVAIYPNQVVDLGSVTLSADTSFDGPVVKDTSLGSVSPSADGSLSSALQKLQFLGAITPTADSSLSGAVAGASVLISETLQASGSLSSVLNQDVGILAKDLDSGGALTFTRSSIAYNPDGSQVAANVPRIFSGGILLEEATTNLFSLAESLGALSSTGDTYPDLYEEYY